MEVFEKYKGKYFIVIVVGVCRGVVLSMTLRL